VERTPGSSLLIQKWKKLSPPVIYDKGKATGVGFTNFTMAN